MYVQNPLAFMLFKLPFTVIYLPTGNMYRSQKHERVHNFSRNSIHIDRNNENLEIISRNTVCKI